MKNETRHSSFLSTTAVRVPYCRLLNLTGLVDSFPFLFFFFLIYKKPTNPKSHWSSDEELLLLLYIVLYLVLTSN